MRSILTFLIALMTVCVPALAEDKTAQWIGIQKENSSATGTVVYHKNFKIDFKVEEAYFKFTCYTPDDFGATRYHAYVNNFSGPSGSYWRDVQIINVSKVLHSGDNEIDIEVNWSKDGTSGPVLAKLVAKGKDKDGKPKSLEIRSDDSWGYSSGKYDIRSETKSPQTLDNTIAMGTADGWEIAKSPSVLPKINTATVVGVTDTGMICGNYGSLDLFNAIKDQSDKYYFINALGFHSMEDGIFGQACYQRPGQWFLGYDKQVARINERANFDLSVSPLLWVPAEWYRSDQSPQMARCIEHNQESFAFSLWNPEMLKFNDSLYSELQKNIGDLVKSISPGIYGDNGEATFMGGQNTWLSPAPEHQHPGFWAGDPLARASFRDKMLEKYGSVDALNLAWKTSFATVDQITYPKLDGTDSRRYTLDFINWYYDSMTDFTTKVCSIAKQYFPGASIFPKLRSGDDNPIWGQDISAIIKAMAKSNAGVRAVRATGSYLDMRRISSACKFYGAKLEIETDNQTNRSNAQRKYFIDASSGCSELFAYPDAMLKVADIFSQSRREINGEHSITEIALFYPTSWHRCNTHEAYPPKLSQAAEEIRDTLDYDVLDENLLKDGALDKYRVLVMFDGNFIDQIAYDKIAAWVNKGGTLILRSEQLPITNIDGSTLPIFGDLEKSKLEDSIHEQGEGQIIVWSGNWNARSDYYSLVFDAAYPSASDGLSGGLDGKPDGVWSSLFKTHAMYVNNTDSAVHVSENISEDIARKAGIDFQPKYLQYSLDIPARSEAVHFFNKPFVESAIECELMQGSQKLSVEMVNRGGYGTPGRAVKISDGSLIGSSFTVGEDATYAFSCILDPLREGIVRLEVDGKSVANITGPGGSHNYMYPINAKMRLKPGKHSVGLRVGNGVFLADKIMITTDIDLAGFTYGFINPQVDQSW